MFFVKLFVQHASLIYGRTQQIISWKTVFHIHSSCWDPHRNRHVSLWSCRRALRCSQTTPSLPTRASRDMFDCTLFKLAFHGADTNTATDILVRILTRKIARRDGHVGEDRVCPARGWSSHGSRRGCLCRCWWPCRRRRIPALALDIYMSRTPTVPCDVVCRSSCFCCCYSIFIDTPKEYNYFGRTVVVR